MVDIFLLLNVDFLKWVSVAMLIAYPMAYYAMQTWLQNFAYRIDLGFGTFVLGGGLAIGIALATVGFQAWKAASANPIEALRCE